MNRIVITGGPGFGKSSIIRELESRKYYVFHEVSREIINEQSRVNGNVVPWDDHNAFNDRVFNGRLEQYHKATIPGKIYFYDRGLPDSLAYLLADNKQVPDNFIGPVTSCTYYNKVFITPPWKDIYTLDKERWEEYEYALKVHQHICTYYLQLNYQLIEIPKLEVRERVNFILKSIQPDFRELI